MLVNEDDRTNRIDQAELCSIYERWPDLFKDAKSINCSIEHGVDFYDSVYFCGMGGSATSCDVLNDIMHYYGNIPSSVLRGHSFPRRIGKRSLVLVNSVSGNTEESVAMAAEAVERSAEVICISSGGRLRELAKETGCKHVNIPYVSVPRASLPYLIIPGINIVNCLLESSVDEIISRIDYNLANVAKRIAINAPDETNIAKQIAYFLEDGFPFCFSSPILNSAATRFKNSLNENAKAHCIHESVLESCHNEIVPFTYDLKNVTRRILSLSWKNDHQLVKGRFLKVNFLMSRNGQPYMELCSTCDDLINAIMESIFILDYSTLYMAIMKEVDPSPTPAIDILKKLNI